MRSCSPISTMVRSQSILSPAPANACGKRWNTAPGTTRCARCVMCSRAQREQMVLAARRLGEVGVLSHSGHGNMSVRLPEDGLLLLTSVSHLSHLTPEQLAVVTFDGEVVEGPLDPGSREIVGMHSC